MTDVEKLCESITATNLGQYTSDEYIKSIDHTYTHTQQRNWFLIWIKAWKNDESAKAHLYQKIADMPEQSLKMVFEGGDPTKFNDKIDKPLMNILMEAFANRPAILKPLLTPYFRELNLKSLYFLKYVLDNPLVAKNLEMSFEKTSFIIAVFLSLLDIEENNNTINGLLCSNLMSLRAMNSAGFDSMFQDHLEALSIEAVENINNNKSSVILTTSLIEFFPRLPKICKEVFLSEDFQVMIQNTVDKSTTMLSMAVQIFQVLSAACCDGEIRTFISLHYVDTLVKCLKVKKIAVYAAHVLVKMWDAKKVEENGVSLDGLSDIFIECVVSWKEFSLNEINYAMEGLSYLSLKTSVLKKLRGDGDFTLSLFQIFKNADFENTPIIYGVLLILAHLCGPIGENIEDDEDNPEIKELRKLANSSQNKNQPVQTHEEIYTFISDYVIDIGFLKELGARQPRFSQNVKDSLTQLLFNICCNNGKKDKLLLQQCSPFSTFLLQEFQKSSQDYNSCAFKTLIKLTMNLNPVELFESEDHMLLMTVYLLRFIPAETDAEYTGSSKSQLLKVVISLSNLASVGDECTKIAPTIIQGSYYKRVESLLNSGTQALQTAALQLVLNCACCFPQTLSKFFNFENADALKNFRTIVSFLYLKDRKGQEAVSALLALASGFPFIASELANKSNLVDAVTYLAESQSEDAALMSNLAELVHNCTECAKDSEMSKCKKFW